MYLSIGGGGFCGGGSFLFDNGSSRGSGSWGVGRGRGVLDGSGGVLDGSRGISRGRGISGSGDVGLGLRVDGDTLVSYLGDVAVGVVSGVLDVLGTAVREGNGVATGNGTIDIGGLGGVELSLGVVIGNTVFISIGGGHRLLNIGWGRGVIGSWGRGVIGSLGWGMVGGRSSYLNDGGVMNEMRSVVNNRSMVYKGSMVQQRSGVVDDRAVGGMHKCGSMVGGVHSVRNNRSVAVANDGV